MPNRDTGRTPEGTGNSDPYAKYGKEWGRHRDDPDYGKKIARNFQEHIANRAEEDDDASVPGNDIASEVSSTKETTYHLGEANGEELSMLMEQHS